MSGPEYQDKCTFRHRNIRNQHVRYEISGDFIMSFLRTFAPWIVYAVVPSHYWQWAALIAACISLIEIFRLVRAGRGVTGMVIDLGSAAFFIALTILAFVDPNTPLHPYSPAISSGVLMIVAGISLLVRTPFTLPIAKQSTPPELWSNPAFIRVNYIITGVWAASFTIGCLLLAILAHTDTPRTVVQVAAFALPALFTLRYTARAQAAAKAANPSIA
ncbi:hypothetical protein [Nocardia jiangxiensis]|uniref:Intracellular septation protein A n=1 Tax=Nocardia jiangxiensis TaxID=282685 RepID=A0ABW6RUY1_9NOCA|nr:hypothetical protein [Nocardia jiangxiensis]